MGMVTCGAGWGSWGKPDGPGAREKVALEKEGATEMGEMRTRQTVKKAGVAQWASVSEGRREGQTHQKGDLAAVEQT